MVRWLFGLLLVSLAAVSGEPVRGRYVRYEAPISGNIEVREIEVFSAGTNVAPQSKFTQIDFDGPKPYTNKVLVDGEKDLSRHGPQFSGSVHASDPKRIPAPIFDPVLEIDLGKEVPIEKVVVYRSRPTQRTWLDKGKRQITVMDDQRRIVAINKYDIWDKPFNTGIETSELTPITGPAAGKVLPAGTHQWLKMGDFFELPLSPPLTTEQQARLDAFKQRNSSENISALSKEFFARVNLSKPQLKPVAELFNAGKHQEALDAFKRHFFKRVERMRTVTLWPSDKFTYDQHGDDILSGVMVTFAGDGAFAQRFQPGLIQWVDIPDDPKLRAKAISDTEGKTKPNNSQWPLLEAYKRTGNVRYLQEWAAISDDWALNFFKQADASPHNVRQLFVMTPLYATSMFFKELDATAQAQPGFIDALPSATLARMLIPMVEEYPPAFWRVARKLVFNHLINAWGDAVLPCYMLNDFYAGERFERENRQHFERMWGGLFYFRDGYPVEVCDEGHSMAPFWSSVMYLHLKDHKYDWLTPAHEDMYFDELRRIARFTVHHLAPGGYSEYLDRYRSGHSVPWYHSGLTLWYEKEYYLGMPAKVTKSVLLEPESRAIMDTCFGKGRIGETLINRMKDEHKQTLAFYEGEYQGLPKTVSEIKPYTGMQYLRRGWKQGDSFVLMLTFNNDTQNAETIFDNTFFRYLDYNFPMVEASGVMVDGQRQYPEFKRKTYAPGSKQSRISESTEKPIPTRWLTTSRFDFTEGWYAGAYGNRGIKDGRLVSNGVPTENVAAARQMIQIRDYRTFIATDRVSHADATASHKHSIDFSVQLSQKKGDVLNEKEQLQIDAEKSVVRVRNPKSANVTLAQFASVPLKYRLNGNKPLAKLGDQQALQFPEDMQFTERKVTAEWETKGPSILITAMIPAPVPSGAAPADELAPGSVKSAQSVKSENVTGFKALMADGGTIEYQAATSGVANLEVGALKVSAEALLLVTKDGQRSGLALGVQSLQVAGAATSTPTDFEFTFDAAGKLGALMPILKPVNPVEILPHERVFTANIEMELKSETPGVEIRYTLDGSEPTLTSPLYTKPVRIEQDSFIKARAFRPGVKEMPVDTSGTFVSEISRGWFYKRAPLESIAAPGALESGLRYEYFESNWFRLYSYANLPGVLPAKKSGVVKDPLDVSMRETDGTFGVRYSGFIQIPADGVYTFHGPREFVHNFCEPGYDLRVYVGGEEWYLGQTWHSLGLWSVPLKAGLHRFVVTYADARAKDVYSQRRELWRDYPQPWVVWDGVAPVIEVSGPNLPKQRLPTEWLKTQKP